MLYDVKHHGFSITPSFEGCKEFPTDFFVEEVRYRIEDAQSFRRSRSAERRFMEETRLLEPDADNTDEGRKTCQKHKKIPANK